jgi:hypothetical protein
MKSMRHNVYGMSVRSLKPTYRLTPKFRKNLRRLLKAPISEWSEWARCWEWIETLLLSSYPEDHKYRLAWYTKLLSEFLRGGRKAVCDNWKFFTKQLRNRIYGSVDFKLKFDSCPKPADL